MTLFHSSSSSSYYFFISFVISNKAQIFNLSSQQTEEPNKTKTNMNQTIDKPNKLRPIYRKLNKNIIFVEEERYFLDKLNKYIRKGKL